jgi:hypothetical protein
MNLLAIVGSPRKRKATDTLVDRAIEGFRDGAPDASIRKVHLLDEDIRHCRNCLTCRDSETDGPYAPCTIHDDMDALREDLHASDALIFGTPVHMGYATGLMTVFLERIIWTFGEPTGRVLTIPKIPRPRETKPRRAITIVTSGLVPPIFRRLCDRATAQIREITNILTAKSVGDLYAGDIERRGVERYLEKAFRLGRKLAG